MASEPKVFVSHASEDKQRFVVKFAQRLRENGVDAWLDQWEMRPGDSLVDKIFEQGLKQAQAVVIVVSAASVHKPWVREELNLSVVKRISQGLKLIPVVIDQCEVPEALQSTIWQRIDDLENYDAAFQRILSAIFDVSDKPVLGKRPERYVAEKPVLPAFTVNDERVLRAVAKYEIDEDAGYIDYTDLLARPELAGVSEQDVQESIEILEQKQAIHFERLSMGGWLRLTLPGFEQYANAFVPGYKESVAQLGALLVNEDVSTNVELVKRTGKPRAFVNAVLEVFEAAQHVAMEKYGSGEWQIVRVAPSLKRALA